MKNRHTIGGQATDTQRTICAPSILLTRADSAGGTPSAASKRATLTRGWALVEPNEKKKENHEHTHATQRAATLPIELEAFGVPHRLRLLFFEGGLERVCISNSAGEQGYGPCISSGVLPLAIRWGSRGKTRVGIGIVGRTCLEILLCCCNLSTRVDGLRTYNIYPYHLPYPLPNPSIGVGFGLTEHVKYVTEAS